MSGHVLRNTADNNSDWPLRLRVDTVIARSDAAVTFDPLQQRIDAPSPLASGHAEGDLPLGDIMQFNLVGELAQWPAQWRTLPGTDPSSPAKFQVAGTGPQPRGVASHDRLAQAR